MESSTEKNFFSQIEIVAEKKISIAAEPQESNRPRHKTDLTTTAEKAAANENQVCENCGDSEWWIDIHFGGPHCINCDPAPARGMIRENFFFDESGSRWNITTAEKKIEVWSKDS